jgi:hypothetical protein
LANRVAELKEINAMTCKMFKKINPQIKNLTYIRTCKAIDAELTEMKIETGYFLQSNKLNKRGLIDTVGELFNMLFGTMDAKDRSLINENINNIYKNQEEIKLFEKESMVFVKSWIDDYKSFKEITKSTMEQIESITNSNIKNLDEMRKILEFGAIIQDISNNHKNLKEKVNKFFQVIILEKLNQEIVQPSKLIKYLNQIEADLPDKKHLPRQKIWQNIIHI